MTHEQWDGVIRRLAEFAPVPTDVLRNTVERDGLCLSEHREGNPPESDITENPDRELAARFCDGCSVPDECLALELRTAGAETHGIWGGLAEDDRRALHPVWTRHRFSDSDASDHEGASLS
ncbi:WhiB family transcriptional regulator [Actinoalloteichus hymeniacidonis]|uniref:Transcription factor WhiB n=1 Tax=Actinoalloteichus hymeniacidonis TaxID=340345 RepID=A0AAC9MZ85_9PSEU|nr:WhiB family transcriptional regulator [Actinoalloteichus hymeniacidonis]AOS63676.1 Transcription factor WhiB [Actinoalloteichus hymeniacidonis]MBB5908274.1 WhiB family redox-sensing transcriptional regulator [Actinoalloteichus hymeniacidonis]